MKTCESFFPTRTCVKSRVKQVDRTFHLIRRPQDPNESYQTLDSQPSQINIFRNSNHQVDRKYSMDHVIARPIGGTDLFRKMDQINKQRNTDKNKNTKKTHKEATQRIINSSLGITRTKKQKQLLPTQDKQGFQNSKMKPVRTLQSYQKKEEMLKSHYTYFPQSSTMKSRQKQTLHNLGHQSDTLLRPNTECKSKKSKMATQAHDQWTQKQRISFQDKMALINQINYKRPLVELYGDRYFQYILRNRFEEDLKPPMFIYQIKQKFTQNKVISKLRKYKPQVQERKQMILRGIRMTHIQE